MRDSRLAATIDDIVVEFASRQSQPILDRYTSGADVSAGELRRVWRDTTKVGSWESPIYAAWLAAIREVNRGLPKAHQLRVLAEDIAVDCTHGQWIALGDNNISFARAIVEEVPAKKRRALIVLGSNRLTKSGRSDGGPNVATRIEERFPGALFMTLLVKKGDCEAPCLYPATDKNADALLYLGPQWTLLRPPPGSLELEYLRELDRRARIEWEDRGP